MSSLTGALDVLAWTPQFVRQLHVSFGEEAQTSHCRKQAMTCLFTIVNPLGYTLSPYTYAYLQLRGHAIVS